MAFYSLTVKLDGGIAIILFVCKFQFKYTKNASLACVLFRTLKLSLKDTATLRD